LLAVRCTNAARTSQEGHFDAGGASVAGPFGRRLFCGARSFPVCAAIRELGCKNRAIENRGWTGRALSAASGFETAT
jgi:hypothetical protein